MTETPVPMLLWCPMCRTRHIDAGDFATKPHHTHACQGCGMVWRPAIVPTVGVAFLPGFKDAEFVCDFAAFDVAAAARRAETIAAGRMPCVHCGAPQTHPSDAFDDTAALCATCYGPSVSCTDIRAKMVRDAARAAS